MDECPMCKRDVTIGWNCSDDLICPECSIIHHVYITEELGKGMYARTYRFGINETIRVEGKLGFIDTIGRVIGGIHNLYIETYLRCKGKVDD